MSEGKIVVVNVCPQGGANHLFDLEDGKCLHNHGVPMDGAK